ncbi:MAG: hypothetical protein AABX47_04045 [Nanoarchaeota archaeon]|mgnify:CR=1 FL=1
MARQAQILGTTAETIIIAIAAITLLLFVGRWSEWIQSEGEIKACQYSISVFTTATKATYDVIKPQIRCPAPHFDLSGNIDSDKRQVAELVRTCWAKTNGRNNGLARTEEGYVREKLGLETGDSFCILCSSFTTDKTVIVADLKEFMSGQTMINAPGKTYKEFIDTSWQSAGADPLDNLFYTLTKPGIVPLPAPLGMLDGATESKTIDAGSAHYMVSFGKGNGNTMAVVSQSDAGNLACDRFLQQRDPGTKLPGINTA